MNEHLLFDKSLMHISIEAAETWRALDGRGGGIRTTFFPQRRANQTLSRSVSQAANFRNPCPVEVAMAEGSRSLQKKRSRT